MAHGGVKLAGEEAGEAEQQSGRSDLPLLPQDIFNVEIKTYLDKLSQEQWKTVVEGDFEPGAIKILSEMLETLVDKFIEETVGAQEHSHTDTSDSGSTKKNIGKTLQGEGSYCRATEKATQATLGDIFHRCFGEALGVVQQKTFNSENLVQLFIEVTERANVSQQSEPPAAANLAEMVYNVIYILRRCAQTLHKWMENQESEEESKECDDNLVNCAENVESAAAAGTEKSETASSKLDSSNELRPARTLVREQPCKSADRRKRQETNFLAEFLMKLIEYVADRTGTNTRDVDFCGILASLTEMTGGKLGPTLPKSVGGIVRQVYGQLVKKYGSKHLMQGAMEFRHVGFEEAVAKILMEEMNKPKGRGKKVNIYIEKKNWDDEWIPPSSEVRSSMVRAMRNLFCCRVVIEIEQ